MGLWNTLAYYSKIQITHQNSFITIDACFHAITMFFFVSNALDEVVVFVSKVIADKSGAPSSILGPVS